MGWARSDDVASSSVFWGFGALGTGVDHLSAAGGERFKLELTAKVRGVSSSLRTLLDSGHSTMIVAQIALYARPWSLDGGFGDCV